MMMNNKLRIVLDTNILIVSFASHFKYYWIFEKLQNGEYDLFVSNEILTEYQEQMAKRFGLTTTDSSLDFLLLLSNVHLINPSFHWQLIIHDTDDNKFVDCAVAANADYIVTQDKHFQVLKDIDFPKVNILSIAEFEKLFL